MTDTTGQVPLVAAMQELWARVFGVEHVAADADFFELGGSSLLAAQLTASLSEVVDGEVSLRAFFESATLDQLAAWVTDELGPVEVPRDRLERAMSLLAVDDLLEPEPAADAQPSEGPGRAEGAW